MQVEHAIQQAEAVFRFTQEVDRRLAECGISGTAELLTLWRQLHDALEYLTLAEIDWAGMEAEQLCERLRLVGRTIDHLTALKTALEVRH